MANARDEQNKRAPEFPANEADGLVLASWVLDVACRAIVIFLGLRAGLSPAKALVLMVVLWLAEGLILIINRKAIIRGLKAFDEI